jgi:hypothetical protein
MKPLESDELIGFFHGGSVNQEGTQVSNQPQAARTAVEKFIALMLKTNFSFNTNIAVWLIKIVLCPLVKGNGFKAN